MSFDQKRAAAREVIRQKMVEELVGEAYAELGDMEPEATSDPLVLAYGIALLQALAMRRKDAINPERHAEIQRMAAHAIETISIGALNEEEARHMILELAEQMIETGTQSFSSAFLVNESRMFREGEELPLPPRSRTFEA